MNGRLKSFGKVALVAGLVVAAAVFMVRRASGLWRTGEEGARVWFYDESERRLYTVPADTIPPDKGIGGRRGDGARAVAVALGGQTTDPARLRVAYLETYAPDLKKVLEAIHAAHAARKKYDGPKVSPESEFYQTNTLVKRVEDKDWSPLASPEGRAITTEWRSWRGPDGQPPIVCVP